MSRKTLVGANVVKSVPTLARSVLDLVHDNIDLEGLYGRAQRDPDRDDLATAIIEAIRAYDRSEVTPEDEARIAKLEAKIEAEEREPRAKFDKFQAEKQAEAASALTDDKLSLEERRDRMEQALRDIDFAHAELEQTVSKIALAEKHELQTLHRKKEAAAESAFYDVLDLEDGTTVNGKRQARLSDYDWLTLQTLVDSTPLHYHVPTGLWYVVPDGEEPQVLGEYKVSYATSAARVQYLVWHYLNRDDIGAGVDWEAAFEHMLKAAENGNLRQVQVNGSVYNGGVGPDSEYVTYNSAPEALTKLVNSKKQVTNKENDRAEAEAD